MTVVPIATAPRFAPPAAPPDFGRTPFVVIWETTRACDLACLHCRASARTRRDPAELSTDEAFALLDRVRDLGPPLFVLTGGDPLKRPDIAPIVRHGTGIGLRVALTPSGTPLMTPDVIAELADAGLARLAVSLDGSSAAIHDSFRGVAGSFDWSVRMLHAARERGLGTQVNTTVSRHNLDDFDALAELMTELGIVLWSVFFVVPTGRARPTDVASADEFERVFAKMHELSLRAPFDIKSTAAPHYRRYAMQHGTPGRPGAPRLAGAVTPPDGGIGRARGVNDGNGFLFVSHTGEIYPSGFLPLSAGNIRTHDLAAVYRDSELFVALRDPSRLKGKCGVCEFRTVCGGSRARAYALTGDPLEAEPFCAHIPPRWAEMVANGEVDPADAYFARRITGWHDGRAHGGERRAEARVPRRSFQLPITRSGEDEP